MNLEYPLNPKALVMPKKLGTAPASPKSIPSSSSQDLKVSTLFSDLFQSHPALNATAKTSFLKCLNFYFNFGARKPNEDEKALIGEHIRSLLMREETEKIKQDKWQKFILTLVADGCN